MTRQISTETPNQIVAQPATTQACQQDRGTPQGRAARAEEVIGQRESAQFHAKASAEAAGGCR